MRPLLPAFAAVAVLASAGAALACTCLPYRSAAEQLRQADLAAVGVAVASRTNRRGEAETIFQLTEVMKGPMLRTVTVRHGTDSAMCGVVFERGRRVMLLAGRDRGGYQTSSCSAAQFPIGEFRRAAGRGPQRPPERPPEQCVAERADFVVGRRYTPDLGEEARRAPRAATLRVRRPGEAYTRDLRIDRLNLDLDRRGRVVDAVCG
jgi:hypothetical protein